MWSAKPLSGEGAAINGGRFNPKGTPALYLAVTLEGAVVEAAQGFGYKLQPLTLCMYEVDCENVVDLTTSVVRRSAGTSLTDLGCPWSLDIADGREPASWRVVYRLIA